MLARLARAEGGGIDGVVAKERSLGYQPGRRAMVKVKREPPAGCVVAGMDPASMALDWVPLRPERVAEVAYDRLDALRFRHPARFVRWRPHRDARSCTFDQLPEAPGRTEVGLPGRR